MEGFQSSNRPSTDALNAISDWTNKDPDRSYETLEDDDDQILIELNWNQSDNCAAPDLDSACNKFGVTRTFTK